MALLRTSFRGVAVYMTAVCWLSCFSLLIKVHSLTSVNSPKGNAVITSSQRPQQQQPSRRDLFRRGFVSTAGIIMLSAPLVTARPAWAATDCYADCVKNCQTIAPKDPEYCASTCRDYCDQPDRRDGLSGSVSYEGGEVGILGGTFGTGTVVKGEDRPPSLSLPGLDFTSPQGKKLIGY